MPDDTFDNTPLDATDADVSYEGEDIELVDDDPESASATDEEMSGEPDDDDVDDDDLALDEDEDEDEIEVSDELRELRELKAQQDAERRRAEYTRQQEQNQAYWDGIENQARRAFQYEFEQIYAQKDNYLDPDAYVRQHSEQLNLRIIDWFNRFGESKNEARRQQYEKAQIPVYAARVATYYDLTEEQAKDLLDYHPTHMQREAEKMARYNQREAAYRKKLQQNRRKEAGQKMSGKTPTGGSRTSGAPTRVKRGSEKHLAHLLFGNTSA